MSSQNYKYKASFVVGHKPDGKRLWKMAISLDIAPFFEVRLSHFPTHFLHLSKLFIISSLLYLLRCTFLHKHNIVINIPNSLTACDRLYSITHHIKNVNKNIDKPLLFAYYYVTVLL